MKCNPEPSFYKEFPLVLKLHLFLGVLPETWRSMRVQVKASVLKKNLSWALVP